MGTTWCRECHSRCRFLRSRDYRDEGRIVRKIGTIDGRIDFAVSQHGQKVFTVWRALDADRIAVFGNMGLFQSDPLHALEIDAVVVLQKAPHPHGSGLTIGANANALVLELLKVIGLLERHKIVPC